MSIAELIKEHTDTESFREYLQVQHGNNIFEYYLRLLQNTVLELHVWDALYQFLEFISGVDTDKVNPYIEKLIATKESLVKVVNDLLIFSSSEHKNIYMLYKRCRCLWFFILPFKGPSRLLGFL